MSGLLDRCGAGTQVFLAVVVVSLGGAPLAEAAVGGTSPGSNPPAKAKPKPKPKPKPPTFPIKKPTWLTGFKLTEYWPVPEKWFRGRKVVAPGVGSSHRMDFLYSATGVAMEGDGVTLSGKHIHWRSGSSGWVNRNARKGGYHWLNEMFWLNRRGEITYPLEAGGWANGDCKRDPRRGNRCSRVKPQGSTKFGSGKSRGASGLELRAMRSIAVDPRVISYRSAVYLPAYDTRSTDGWFCAADTGGAIRGRHIDVFRTAPRTVNSGMTRRGQKVRVLPPATARSVLPFLCR